MGGNTLSGGRRRRRASKRKTMKGGNMIGFDIDPQIGTAGAGHPPVANAAVNPQTLQPIANDYMATGGRRRRTSKKTRKGGRKSRKGLRRRRTMRGGASWYSPANSGGSFGGDGQAGLVSLRPYAVNVPGGGPVEGGDGVMRV